MNIDQGLFKFDFTDYHAILGVPLEADAKQIRKRYLKIARKLHPDSLSGATVDEKQQASEFLSKMVNPAYEKLTQEKEATEYRIVLKMRGQQLSKQPEALQLQFAPAQELVGSKNSNVDSVYNSSLQPLADEQYASLEQVLSITGQISELNLAYLVRTAGAGGAPTAAPSAAPAAANNDSTAPTSAATPASAPTSPRQHRASIIERYLNRAKEFEAKNDFSRGILEMREAIQSHPNNAECHSYLANLYLKAGQTTMARIHIKRALEINPNDNLAKLLEPRVGKSTAKSAEGDKAKGGGLFGLFGGKRK
ncbi:J domain-containing protein [Leptolyngbya sp. PCC 6406]|uniref:J domain-containing protein n=1 Tax=Leptolyngbya sp. PCC 6406 TaxID=1173264 RepID=UPI0002AC6F17|nr:J domain-containing protein [Leptolyngbya sp. PCC 6406]